jgi:hypothetical protein
VPADDGYSTMLRMNVLNKYGGTKQTLEQLFRGCLVASSQGCFGCAGAIVTPLRPVTCAKQMVSIYFSFERSTKNTCTVLVFVLYTYYYLFFITIFFYIVHDIVSLCMYVPLIASITSEKRSF